MSLTVLSNPIIRRVGDRRLVVHVTEDGLVIRGYRRRKSKFVTWEQIASLSDDSQMPLIAQSERAEGQRTLQQLGAD